MYLSGLPTTHSPDFDVTVPNEACSPVLVDCCVASEPSCVADDAVLDDEAVVEDAAVSEDEAVGGVCVVCDDPWSTAPLDAVEDAVEIAGDGSSYSPEAAEVAVFDDDAVEDGWDQVWSPIPLEVAGAVVVVGVSEEPVVEVGTEGVNPSSSEPLHSRLKSLPGLKPSSEPLHSRLKPFSTTPVSSDPLHSRDKPPWSPVPLEVPVVGGVQPWLPVPLDGGVQL
jgi:hypothetical protein